MKKYLLGIESPLAWARGLAEPIGVGILEGGGRWGETITGRG